MESTAQIQGVKASLPMYRTLAAKNNSISGDGSQMHTTEDVRLQLPLIFERFAIGSVTDAPCGDFYWMQHVDLSNVDYVGYDVIEEIVAENQLKFGSPTRSFHVLDILNQIVRKSDLLICRDFLFHISNDDICRVLANFRKSGCAYLLSTTFDYVEVNVDKSSDNYDSRPINLSIEPFCLGKPVSTFVETHPACRRRSMSLWSLSGDQNAVVPNV